MRRPHAWAVAAVLVMSLLTGCGGGSDSGSSDDSGSTEAAAPESSGSQDSGGGAGSVGNGGGDDGGIAYVPWGPKDPPIPTQYSALAQAAGDASRCAAAAEGKPDSPFWAVASAVCAALMGDGPWPSSTNVPAPPEPPNAYQACLDDELTAMVERALRWHAENPGRKPKVTFVSPTTISPCQARIYDVRVLEDQSPAENAQGKVPVAVTASALDEGFSVTVDGQPVETTGDFKVKQPAGDGLRTVVVLAPAGGQAREAKLAVTTTRGTLEATVQLPAAVSSPSTGEPSSGEPSSGEPSSGEPSNETAETPTDTPS